MDNLLNTLEKLFSIPRNASADKGQVDELILFVHILMVALFIGWFCYFVLVLYKFNNKRNPKADYVGVRNHFSTKIEITVALIEAALLVGLALPIWAKTVDQFPKGPDVTTIKVIGQQFQWNAWYPGTNGLFVSQDEKLVSGINPFGFKTNDPNYQENFVVSKDIYVPVNKSVVAYISSLDVIHSFACRPMRATQDAVPGMSIPLWFKPVEVGNYSINCAQLCGTSHALMKGVLHVVPQADYDKWLLEKASAPK